MALYQGHIIENHKNKEKGKEGKNRESPFYCRDKKSPCKCKTVRNPKLKEYFEHSCARDAKSEALLAKLHDVGLNMECHQMKSTMTIKYLDAGGKERNERPSYNSGCELRFIDAPKVRPQIFQPQK